MPSKHVIKEYVAESFYHVYSSGVEKRQIFTDERDFTVFLNILRRYLGPEAARDPYRRKYPHLADKLELNAYCLMQNHFHLLVYQHTARALADLMRSLLTSYSMYFNRRYGRTGNLFQSRYHASRLTDEGYLLPVSRYIHLNPLDYQNYPYSSYPYYVGLRSADWIKPQRILASGRDQRSYAEYLADQADYKQTLGVLRKHLADN